eukprot:CAMPEP_0114534710 /NCGR_PEP_ID=MMETSP0109-20121206/27994_1 /TAXON_ID=29199 /ORGANISM="Chlorarachnion reptans, Strain CCCM449" /LENGTH=966 /DNA_ID=CAMNT_0001718159 /DNA_START=523 /DNA_END=3421 /DNA_ORIENTATION=+
MSSSDGVLTAIKLNHPLITKNNYISTNHFDIDSFVSVWSYLNRDLAIKFDQVLREVARIGDFRELRLEESFQLKALKLCCWLNTVEKKNFYEPFESSTEKDDSDVEKFEYFLPKFSLVLEDPDSFKKDWSDEYARVIFDYALINKTKIEGLVEEPDASLKARVNVKKYKNIDLVLVSCPDPVHYYALFSVGRDFDIVVSIYDEQRYEVELKYTTYVDIDRPVLPRVSLEPLVRVLNSYENGDLRWHAPSFKDSGPLLRLDPVTEDEARAEDRGLEDKKRDKHKRGFPRIRKLSKAQRYGNPFGRPIYSSNLESSAFKAIVLSYFRWGYSTNHGLRDRWGQNSGKERKGGNALTQVEDREDAKSPVSELVGHSADDGVLDEFDESSFGSMGRSISMDLADLEDDLEVLTGIGGENEEGLSDNEVDLEEKGIRSTLWSALQHGEYKIIDRKRNWTWKEIQQFNRKVCWTEWEEGLACLAEKELADTHALLGPNYSLENVDDTFLNDFIEETPSAQLEEKEKTEVTFSGIPPPPANFPAAVPGLPPPPPGIPPPPGLSLGRSNGIKKKRNGAHTPLVPMKRLHWISVDESDACYPDSIWAKMQSDLPLDVEEISMLFPASRNRRKRRECSSSGREKGSELFSFLDSKREMNISIALSGLRMTPEELCEAIHGVDLSVLTADHMEQLLSILPTAEESKAAGKFSGSLQKLATASKFHSLILAMDVQSPEKPMDAKVVESRRKKLVARMRQIAFMHILPENLGRTYRSLQQCSAAVLALESSVRLRDILSMVRTLGNFMNYSVDLSRICLGFGLDTLLKLHMTKAEDKTMSLLDFVAGQCIKNFPESCNVKQPFAEEFRSVIGASKIDSEHTASELGNVRKQLKALGKDLKTMAVDIHQGQQAHDGIDARFYQTLSKRFMKCAKIHDSMQRAHRATQVRFQRLLQAYGESKSRFEKMEDFFSIFGNFSIFW